MKKSILTLKKGSMVLNYIPEFKKTAKETNGFFVYKNSKKMGLFIHKETSRNIVREEYLDWTLTHIKTGMNCRLKAQKRINIIKMIEKHLLSINWNRKFKGCDRFEKKSKYYKEKVVVNLKKAIDELYDLEDEI